MEKVDQTTLAVLYLNLNCVICDSKHTDKKHLDHCHQIQPSIEKAGKTETKTFNRGPPVMILLKLIMTCVSFPMPIKQVRIIIIVFKKFLY